MSYETVLLPKYSPDGTIILAKEQFHNSYNFWAMPILIFSPVYLLMRHPLIFLSRDKGTTGRPVPSKPCCKYILLCFAREDSQCLENLGYITQASYNFESHLPLYLTGINANFLTELLLWWRWLSLANCPITWCGRGRGRVKSGWGHTRGWGWGSISCPLSRRSRWGLTPLSGGHCGGTPILGRVWSIGGPAIGGMGYRGGGRSGSRGVLVGRRGWGWGHGTRGVPILLLHYPLLGNLLFFDWISIDVKGSRLSSFNLNLKKMKIN